MYTLDTNPIIYCARNESVAVKALEKLFQKKEPIYVSALTELELFSSKTTSEEEETEIENLLSWLRIVPVTSEIARIAADLRRRTSRIKAFDSAIAATALFTNSTLITRNVRDFEKVPGLEILAI